MHFVQFGLFINSHVSFLDMKPKSRERCETERERELLPENSLEMIYSDLFF